MFPIQRTYRHALILWLVPCTMFQACAAFLACASALPWHQAIAKIMLAAGAFGIMPLMLSANSFMRARDFEVQQGEPELALMLFRVGLLLLAIGLLGFFLTHPFAQ